MFTKDMIAPCGLDCSICKRALAGTGSLCRMPRPKRQQAGVLFREMRHHSVRKEKVEWVFVLR